MIGVLANDADRPVAQEFFELFKTPWEFYRDEGHYSVIICGPRCLPESAAQLVLIYGGGAGRRDKGADGTPTLLAYDGRVIPIYRECATFPGDEDSMLREKSSRKPVLVETGVPGSKQVRVGFDLFSEIRFLLTSGQPIQYAEIPTLELHISVLRDLILGAGITLVEIPPVPARYSFLACLTHDVDHVGIRNHRFDHTIAGFLYRATIGSLINVFRGRRTLGEMGANWGAAFSLPFVHLGLARDFWHQFDHYMEIEKGLGSTFFVIPRKNDPGQAKDGRRYRKRAAQYDIAEIQDELRRVVDAGHEIGLHGIDAWRDTGKANEERARVEDVCGAPVTGTRMHWLYFDDQAHKTLEKGGLSYDSTVGYNGTVGYRAGTTQVFKPLGTEKLLELPMHIMDTALFYPSHRNLAPKQARVVVDGLLENAKGFGGVLTINWHDRSIAPERLWDGFYIDLLNELKSQKVWFPTASKAVAWFKVRRSAVMEIVSPGSEEESVRISAKQDPKLPGLTIRVHTPQAMTGVRSKPSVRSVDIELKETLEVPLAATVCL